VKSLSSRNINSVCEWSNDQSWTVTEVFITIVEDSIGDSEDEVVLSGIVTTLELSLPLELIRLPDTFPIKFKDDIS